MVFVIDNGQAYDDRVTEFIEVSSHQVGDLRQVILDHNVAFGPGCAWRIVFEAACVEWRDPDAKTTAAEFIARTRGEIAGLRSYSPG